VEQQKTSTVREMLLGALSKPPFVRVDYTVSFNLKMTHDIATGGLNECRERLYTQPVPIQEKCQYYKQPLSHSEKITNKQHNRGSFKLPRYNLQENTEIFRSIEYKE
jgi:hypothetical protein